MKSISMLVGLIVFGVTILGALIVAVFYPSPWTIPLVGVVAIAAGALTQGALEDQ